MRTTHLAVATLRVMLVLAFLLLVVFQTLSIPGQFAYMAKEEPDVARLQWPLTVFGILLLACVQVVIVSTWKLLTLVKRDRIFSEGALKWVDTIVGAISTAWVMLFGVFLYISITGDDPGMPMLLLLILVGGAVLDLLMVVMRTLLRQATMLQTDMEEVI